MTHLKMQLSERETNLVKEVLNEAYQQGGRELQFVLKKLIMTIYWHHMTCLFTDAEGTVYHILTRMTQTSNYIKKAINIELFNFNIYDLDDGDTILDDIINDNTSVYKGIKIKYIIDTRQSSLKPFMDSLRQVIDCGEYNKTKMKELGLIYSRPALDDDNNLPF